MPHLRLTCAIGCLGLLAVGLLAENPASGPASSPATSPASGPGEGRAVSFTIHDGYFVSNQFEPNAESSFVVIRSQKEFDALFGVAMVMGDKSLRLPANAFDTKLVVAVVKRGKAVWEYKVEAVAAEGKTLTVRYTAAPKDGGSAQFATPLILSIDKGDYAAVAFVENGKPVKKIELSAPLAGTLPAN